jgi:hypothetical protein
VGLFGDRGSGEVWRGLRGKLVYFPLDPLQSSRDPLVTKSTLTVPDLPYTPQCSLLLLK